MIDSFRQQEHDTNSDPSINCSRERLYVQCIYVLNINAVDPLHRIVSLRRQQRRETRLKQIKVCRSLNRSNSLIAVSSMEPPSPTAPIIRWEREDEVAFTFKLSVGRNWLDLSHDPPRILVAPATSTVKPPIPLWCCTVANDGSSVLSNKESDDPVVEFRYNPHSGISLLSCYQFHLSEVPGRFTYYASATDVPTNHNIEDPDSQETIATGTKIPSKLSQLSTQSMEASPATTPGVATQMDDEDSNASEEDLDDGSDTDETVDPRLTQTNGTTRTNDQPEREKSVSDNNSTQMKPHSKVINSQEVAAEILLPPIPFDYGYAADSSMEHDEVATQEETPAMDISKDYSLNTNESRMPPPEDFATNRTIELQTDSKTHPASANNLNNVSPKESRAMDQEEDKATVEALFEQENFAEQDNNPEAVETAVVEAVPKEENHSETSTEQDETVVDAVLEEENHSKTISVQDPPRETGTTAVVDHQDEPIEPDVTTGIDDTSIRTRQLKLKPCVDDKSNSTLSLNDGEHAQFIEEQLQTQPDNKAPANTTAKKQQTNDIEGVPDSTSNTLSGFRQAQEGNNGFVESLKDEKGEVFPPRGVDDSKRDAATPIRNTPEVLQQLSGSTNYETKAADSKESPRTQSKEIINTPRHKIADHNTTDAQTRRTSKQSSDSNAKSEEANEESPNTIWKETDNGNQSTATTSLDPNQTQNDGKVAPSIDREQPATPSDQEYPACIAENEETNKSIDGNGDSKQIATENVPKVGSGLQQSEEKNDVCEESGRSDLSRFSEVEYSAPISEIPVPKSYENELRQHPDEIKAAETEGLALLEHDSKESPTKQREEPFGPQLQLKAGQTTTKGGRFQIRRTRQSKEEPKDSKKKSENEGSTSEKETGNNNNISDNLKSFTQRKDNSEKAASLGGNDFASSFETPRKDSQQPFEQRYHLSNEADGKGKESVSTPHDDKESPGSQNKEPNLADQYTVSDLGNDGGDTLLPGPISESELLQGMLSGGEKEASIESELEPNNDESKTEPFRRETLLKSILEETSDDDSLLNETGRSAPKRRAVKPKARESTARGSKKQKVLLQNSAANEEKESRKVEEKRGTPKRKAKDSLDAAATRRTTPRRRTSVRTPSTASAAVVRILVTGVELTARQLKVRVCDLS